ncbi:hypothetical protein BC936DRAFT_141878 [Jimgerdemannia flammicorona]|uniref:Uncharacterized protein n=1 Tax=Jimgerdemannia flammicorona TaxID=994334 RepID=A0A433A1G6_9FUNG|nr:hypothetical protein BC936DRAFT_141878 [Jimgerdemannia flammicorona]
MKNAESDDYLQITSPTLWSLDEFAEWCSSCETFEGDKVKILDHIKKGLEMVIDNKYIEEGVRRKAAELHRNFKDCMHSEVTIRCFLCYNLKRLSQGTIRQLEERLFVCLSPLASCGTSWDYSLPMLNYSFAMACKWKLSKSTKNYFELLGSRYETKRKLALIENQKTIKLAEIEHIKVSQLRDHTESTMRINQHITDGFETFTKQAQSKERSRRTADKRNAKIFDRQLGAKQDLVVIESDHDEDEDSSIDKDSEIEEVEESERSTKRNRIDPGIVSDTVQIESTPTSNLASILRAYCLKSKTSPFDPAHSYILDLTPNSKIFNEFGEEKWIELLANKSVGDLSYYHEIDSITDKLFGPSEVKMSLLRARQSWKELINLTALPYDEKFSYAREDWEKVVRWAGLAVEPYLDAFEAIKSPLQPDCQEREWFGDYVMPLLGKVLKLDGVCRVPWGEISVQASQNRRNREKDVLTESVDRAHMADMLCVYDDYEVICLLACGGPYDSNPTKYSSDKFKLIRIMKDMLDELIIKFHGAGMNSTGLYILGIQTYLSDVSVYLMEKKEVYHLHLLKNFSLPLMLTSYRKLKIAIQWAWNLRGLLNGLVHKLDGLMEPNGTPPPRGPLYVLPTTISPRKRKKSKSFTK